MKRAFLIDSESVGGGMEYIRRQIAAHPDDEAYVFTADRGECTAASMNGWNADVIHVNHLKALLQLFRNPFRRPHGKIIFTVHGIHLRKYDFLPHTPMNRIKRVIRQSLERWLYHRCDRIIALTNTDAIDIKRLYGAELPIMVEPNVVDGSEFAAPSNLRYGADEFAFVCIARFDFQKGQDILLAAIARLQNALRASGRRTLLIGDGSTLEEMKRFAARNGIEDIVEFSGEIPDAGVYMTCGRTLVAPSRWEGMPYLMLEAVVRNRNVIASDCPGNRDVLRNYPNAHLFPVEDVAALSATMEAAK